MTRPARVLWVATVLAFVAGSSRPAAAKDFEVWLIDQSNSPGKSFGGAIYIYDGNDLMGENAASAPAEKIDLGAATSALCMTETGANPVRPHMLLFNWAESHGALSFVASGHVVIFHAPTRTPLACFRMAAGSTGARQAHAVWPTRDDQYFLVANQNGKRFERIHTNYAANTFTYEPAAAVDLVTCVTPSGAACEAPGVRPDNAPICPFQSSDSGPAFATLRGGGLLLIDPFSTPMRVVGEYDVDHVRPNGCGLVEARGHVYLSVGGGTASNLDEFTVYRVPMAGLSGPNPPNTPAAELLFTDPSPNRDAHGVAASKHQRYVWIFDRAGNVAEVFDTDSGLRVNTVDLVSDASADPTPDLAAEAPSGNRMFVSLRGPIPLSGDPHASTGSTPGLGVVQINQNGRGGRMKAIVRISNIDAAGVERADAHGIRLRLK